MAFKREHKRELQAGLLAGLLFFGVLGLGLSMIFIMLPAIPLCYLALSREGGGRLAMAIAATLVLFSLSLGASVFFVLLVGLPSLYFARELMRGRGVGITLSHLTLVAAAVLLMFAAYQMPEGGLQAVSARGFNTEVDGLNPELVLRMREFWQHWAFLIYGMIGWFWLLLLYAHAAVAQWLLLRSGQNGQAELAISVFEVPRWMMAALCIAALASLIGSAPMAFIGKAVFLTLLLPYFLLGVALIHLNVREWPNRAIFLFFFYIFVGLLFWPALPVAAYGLFHALRESLASRP